MHLQSYTPLLNSPPLFDKNSNKGMESNILQTSLRIQVLFVREIFGMEDVSTFITCGLRRDEAGKGEG